MTSPNSPTTLQKLLRAKSVGYIGGLCLVFNQMTGPAIPFTSANFQDPGWVITTLLYIIFTIVSGYAMLYLVEAIQSIPGNSHFQGDVEYGTIINFYFGSKLHFAAQLILYGALQSNAIQCIILTAQATDNLIITIFGRTCGLSFSNGFICVAQKSSTLPSPFESQFMVFTIGLLFVMACCLPLAIVGLDDNIIFNIVTAILSLVLGCSWIMSAFVTGIDTSRHRDVNTQHLIWVATIGSGAYYVIIGVLCALGFQLDDSAPIVTTISIGLFAYVMLLPSIPVSFIVSRNNLVQNDVTSPRVAMFLSFVLPWILLIPLQTGTIIFEFQTWMALFFCSTANFIIPFAVYFKWLHSIKLLRAIHHVSDRIGAYIDVKANRSEGQQPEMTAAQKLYKTPQITVTDESIDVSHLRNQPHKPEHDSHSGVAHQAASTSGVIVLSSNGTLYPGSAGNEQHSRSSHDRHSIKAPSIHSVNGRTSRDSRVDLQAEFDEQGHVAFVDSEIAGLPRELLQMDIPEPDVQQSIYASHHRTDTTGRLFNMLSSATLGPATLTRRGTSFDVNRATAPHQQAHHQSPLSPDFFTDPKAQLITRRPSVPSVTQQSLSPSLHVDDKGSKRSTDAASMAHSLPVEPGYVAPPFRTVPLWFPIPQRMLASSGSSSAIAPLPANATTAGRAVSAAALCSRPLGDPFK
ncbi:hypothetical protein BC831DRAFT_476120 [Entophlyctis helioformis]|nr:hypothetical protein BC831DRAFT_476120 [Entophlyctis helioformis]